MRSWILVLGVMGAGCGEPQRTERTEAALSQGSLDEAGVWPGVGLVLTGRAGNCTGTLVHADGETGLVLTAAHCIFDLFREHGFYGVSPRGFRFGPAQDIEVEAGRVGLHPRHGWDRSVRVGDPWPLTGAYDLAVVEVSGLPPEAADWVIPVWDAPEAPVAVGDDVTLVGFGGPALGMRQVAPARVGGIGNFPVHGAGFIRVLAQDGSVTCPGDSGGPVVVYTPEGPRVVGVHSTGSPDCLTADAWSSAADAREALPVIASILQEGRPPRPETCAACAGASGSCTETRNALIQLSAARFESCIRERTPDGTLARCSEQFPAIREAYDAHWACLETTCGAGVCTDPSRIMTLCEYSHDGSGPCDECIVSRCCKRASICVNDPECRACANTTEPNEACRGNQSLRQLYECLRGRCDETCGAYVGEVVARVLPPVDAGLPDAAVPDAAFPDAAVPDAAVPDAAVPDAAPGSDAGVADAEPAGPAAAEADDGCQAGTGPSRGPWLLALAAIIRRRRPST